MGAQASKTGAAASATVAKRAAAETPVVIRTNLTREDVAVMASRLVLGASAPADGVSGVQRPGNLQPQQEIVEMQDELLQHAQRFDDFGKVEYLAEMTKEFERTASSHRPRSSTPVSMPKDRTAAVSTGGIVIEEDLPGRVTNAQLRTLLKLHYEEPSAWTPEVLAAKYAMDEKAVRAILTSVGPANVLPPAGPSEHPLGVWYPPTLPA